MALTTKQIANKIKAKGLQKLRWYCQMCEKQCRDENGFKVRSAATRALKPQLHACDCSELIMALFRDDPSKFMDSFSKEFEQFFMEVMKRKGGLRVRANTVYQEVVADRQHIHMNSTKWETLGDFVQYLGKTGLCRVDHNEKGWWVTYIDRDPRVLARQEELAKRAEQSRDEEERAAERLEKQLEEARAAEEAIKAARAEAGAGEAGDGADAQPELSRELGPRGEDDKIEFNISAAPHAASSHATSAAAAASPAVAASSGAPAASSVAPAAAAIAPKPSSMSLAKPSVFKAFSSDSSSSAADSGAAVGSKRKAVPGASTLDALMAENERQKEQEQAMKKLRAEAPAAAQPSTAAASTSSGKWLDYWLTPNIVVKILNKKLLGGALYKQKGVVVRVIDRYVGEIRLLGPGADGAPPGSLLRIDQAELETVLPALGKLVRVVNGVYRGEIAVLLELDEARYAATLRIESGLLRGKEVSGVDYEDICKLHEGP